MFYWLSNIKFKSEIVVFCTDYVRPLKKPVRARYCKGLFTQVPFRDGSVYNVSIFSIYLKAFDCWICKFSIPFSINFFEELIGIICIKSFFSWRSFPSFLWHLCLIKPLHPNISIHILHTVLYTFPKVLTRRICLTIKSFFSWWSFPLFSWP